MKIVSVPSAAIVPSWPTGERLDAMSEDNSVPKWSKIIRAVSGTHALAVTDQVVVSATSFLTMVMIGRWTDPKQLGAYAIGYSVLASILAIQESLISLPYSIQRLRPLGTPAEFAGSSLAQSWLLSAVGVAALIVGALGLSASGGWPELATLTWVLAAVTPFALLREFGRRFAFARLQVAHALTLDVTVAAVQLGLLVYLGWDGRMSAVTACGVLGLSCGLAAIGWLIIARADFSILLRQIRPTIRHNWRLGKWLFLAQITVQIQQYITYWILAVVAGAAVTGVYAACMTVVSFANPIVTGFRNVLTPRLVLAWSTEGGEGLKRQTIQVSLVLAAITSVFCLAVLFAGEEVMHFLYHGKEYAGHGQIVSILALAMLAAAAGMPASNALASMERPRAIVAVGAMGALVTMLLVWSLLTKWGLLGAAYGFLAGNVFGSVGRWVAFLALVPRHSDPASVVPVLQNLTQTFDDRDWKIERLAEGDHGIVYSILSNSRKAIWNSYPRLVIKLFKPAAVLNEENVHAQFDALERLNSTVDGRIVDGWTISTPKPLYICRSPLALVMTAVPGKDLKSCDLALDERTIQALDSAGRVLVAVMQDCWSRGQLHGDLAPQNILCDVDAKTLSLIDPGTPESCLDCNRDRKDSASAVFDLAHLLWAWGIERADIANPVGRRRKHIFAYGALRAFIATMDPFEARRRLSEIRKGVQTHLQTTLDMSWSLRGGWHRFVKYIAVRRIESMLGKLEAELGTSAAPLQRLDR